MRARKHVYKIYIQKKWDLKEEATSFAIGPQFHILILQINEPYVVALGSNYVVIVWNLQKEKKIYEFFPPPDRCAWIWNMIVKCNNDVFITAYCDDIDGTLLTLRQMPCDAHLDTDFPVIDVLSIPNFQTDSMFLEDQRIVLFAIEWTKAKGLIVSMEPFRIVREWEIERADNKQEFHEKWEKFKYCKGWLIQSDIRHSHSKHFFRMTNIDTGEVILQRIQRLGFNFANNHLVTFRENSSVLIFEVWNLPQLNYSKETKLLYSFQQRKADQSFNYRLKIIHFDGIQFWIGLEYNTRSGRQCQRLCSLITTC